jgi:hypothetical protein
LLHLETATTETGFHVDLGDNDRATAVTVACSATEPGRRHVFLVCPAGSDQHPVVRQRPLKPFVSSHGGCIQTSCSKSVVRINGIAFGWIGPTTAFGDVVGKP